MSRKRLLNAAEQEILEEAGSNLGAASLFLEEYRSHTRRTARAVLILLRDTEEELARLVKGDYRRSRHGEEAGNDD
jgi:hypothetical protein